MTQLALEGLGGSGWYRMGWSGFILGGVGLGPGGWKMGTGGGEEPLLSSQENPRALCQLRKTVSPCQGALATRAASQSCSKPSLPCCVDPDKKPALSGYKQEIFLLLRRGLSSEF